MPTSTVLAFLGSHDLNFSNRCPTLVLRGACSDLLLPETVAQMAQCGVCASSVDIPKVGDAPMLMESAQVKVLRRLLLV